MKMKTGILSWVGGFGLCLMLALLWMPMSASAAQIVVTNEEEFMEALSDATVDSIILSGEIRVFRSNDGKDNALVIERPVTIMGGSLYVERAGIVLGGAVTFRDTSIYFANSVRNAIIANGYPLTLDNVSNGGSPYSIHLFCGGVTDYTGGNLSELPAAGMNGHITIEGENTLGNIYAGCLSDVENGSEDRPNDYTGTAVITIQNGADGFGEIYAHGAREDRSGGKYNALLADPALYKASGGVSIYLNDIHNITVYGETGGNTDAALIYTDNGKGYSCSPLLKSIGSITLNPSSDGTVAKLAPAQGSTLSDTAVMLPTDTQLDFTGFATDSADMVISSLSGGGTLVLDSTQTLTIMGTVSETTRVAIGGVNAAGDTSLKMPVKDQTYIAAAQSEDESFALLLPITNEELIFSRDDGGNWSVEFPAYTTLIESISIPDTVVSADNTGVVIPVEVIYSSTGFDSLTFIPFTVFVNGEPADMLGDADTGYDYISGTADNDIEFYFGVDETGSKEILAVWDYDFRTGTVPAGTYKISFTVPAENMASGEDYTFTVNLKVGDQIPVTPVTDIFTDVSGDSWYEEAVQYVYEKGLMEGNGDKFTPNGKMTRGMFVMTLYRLAGEPEITDHSACEDLGDVAENAWYTDAVCWAYANNITTGYLSDRTFRTNTPLTREQLATFLYRYAEYQGLNVAASDDLSELLNADKVKPYAKKEVKWAVGAGIIGGMEIKDEAGETAYDLAPQQIATRAQMAKILMNFCNIYGI